MPPFGGQSIRDKTSEFRAIAERLRKEQVPHNLELFRLSRKTSLKAQEKTGA